jgi:serpin B
VVVSPLSIGVAFGMADVGASGATAEELAALFALPASGEDRWAAFNTLEQDVSSDEGPTVRLANRLFPDEDFGLVDGYDRTLARWFGARAEPLPLRAQPDASRLRINEWVAEQTEDLIPDLLGPGAITPQTVLVLVNALYLEAEWATPFGKYPTEDLPFTLTDGSTVTVPLMHELELTGPAVAGEDYTATEVPYAGGELSMLVVVPAEGRFDRVQARLADGLLDEIDAAATTGPVELWLPRFASDTALDLGVVFEEDLGTRAVFGPDGTWDGIAPEVFLASGVHAADIEVDEEGTVAAAATALMFDESGPPEPQVVVRADRPFLYAIRHRSTGAVLFVGRVMDPST